MALFGLVATYATCVAHGSSNAPLALTEGLFITYWVLFEAFDILRVRDDAQHWTAALLFPLNAAGFLFLTYIAWHHKAPADMWIAATIAAGLYAVSGHVRALIDQPGWEPPLTLSAILGGFAIVSKVPGLWIAAGLALEAELLYLLSIRVRSEFLRYLAGIGFAVSLGRVVFFDHGTTTVLGHAMNNWTPALTLHAVLFYANRVLRTRAWIYASLASFLTAVVFFMEVPDHAIAAVWLVLAAVLLDIGIRKQLREFRIHSYVLLPVAAVFGAFFAGPVFYDWAGPAASLAVMYAIVTRVRLTAVLPAIEIRYVLTTGAIGTALLAMSVIGWSASNEYTGVLWCALAIGLLELGLRGWPAQLRYPALLVWCAGAAHLYIAHVGEFVKFPAASMYMSFFGAAAAAWAIAARSWKTPILRDSFAMAGGAFMLPAIWMVAPKPFVTALWMAVAVGGFELATLKQAHRLQRLAQLVMTPVILRALFVDLADTNQLAGISERMLVVAPVVLVLYYFWGRLYSDENTRVPALIHQWAGGFIMLAMLETEFGASQCGLGWALFVAVLMFAGVLGNVRDLRVQSCTVALATLVLALWNNLFGQADVVSDSAVIVALYASAWIARGLTDYERHTAPVLSSAASLLLATVLYNQVSGGLLTVAWGLEGVLLLGTGFAIRGRSLRLQGLTVLLACILKLFFYDLRNLETLYRILSFIALGVILLAVSWVYTRFRELVKRYF
jgi:hypothetical protein